MLTMPVSASPARQRINFLGKLRHKERLKTCGIADRSVANSISNSFTFSAKMETIPAAKGISVIVI
jgi:hypothetical protein